MQIWKQDGHSGSASKRIVNLRILSVPRTTVTDKQRRYGAAMEDMLPSVAHNSSPQQQRSENVVLRGIAPQPHGGTFRYDRQIGFPAADSWIVMGGI